MFFGNVGNLQHPFPAHDRAGGVAGETNEQRFGARRNQGFNGRRIDLKIIVGIGRQIDHFAAG